jgi:branched-chain amino acid transport system permease protein
VLSLLPLLLVNGVVFGAIYGLNAVGFSIMYNATGIINFTQGEFVMLGGMLTLLFYADGRVPLPVAAVGAIAATTLIGLAIERGAIRPLWRRRSRDWTYIFMLFAVATVVPNVVMIGISRDAQTFPAWTGSRPLALGPVAIAAQGLWVLGVTAAVAVALHVLFNHTLTGKAMKAVAVNRRAAGWMGIPVERMVALSFGLSAFLGGLGGVVFTPLITTQFNIGLSFTLKGFAAAIIGGLGNVSGAIVGGLVLGLIEALSTAFVSSLYGDAVTYGILLVILLVRPSGLFRPLVELQQEEI